MEENAGFSQITLQDILNAETSDHYSGASEFVCEIERLNKSLGGYTQDEIRGLDDNFVYFGITAEIDDLPFPRKDNQHTQVRIFIAGPEYQLINKALREIKGLAYSYQVSSKRLSSLNEDLIDSVKDENMNVECYFIELELTFSNI